MRKFYQILVLFLFLFNNSLQANPDVERVKNALTSLNSYWAEKEVAIEELANELDLNNDVDLIQLHLQLVIEELNSKYTEHLNKKQKQSRAYLLKELKTYALNGIFPQNTFHASRTPYFIDKYGNACAVGYMIQRSGHEDLAQKLSSAFNYHYISDMPIDVLEEWSNEYGFTVNELKWIQPSYGPQCPPGTQKDPICHDGEGCFNPDFASDSLIPPYTVTYEYNDGSGWVLDSIGYIFMFGARVGQHRVTCIDSLNITKVYNYTINNVPDINIQTNITHQTDSVNCNGTISIQTSVDPPYQLNLLKPDTNLVFNGSNGTYNNLCAGNYLIIVYDSNFCQKTKSIQVNNLATSLKDNKLNNLKVFPNPVEDDIYFNGIDLNGIRYKIYSLNGELQLEGSLINRQPIKTKNLSAGTYILKLENQNNFVSKKIVKSN